MLFKLNTISLFHLPPHTLKVRAANLQELIYKGGNAGVTKATVSVTFDNSDKNQTPPGYQDYEEITITRQVK